MEVGSAQSLADLQAQFAEMQQATAGLEVTVPESRKEASEEDAPVYAEIQNTRSAVDDLALPVDSSYQNFEAGQQIAGPTEDFATNPLVVEAQDSTRQRIGSLEMPDFPAMPAGYSGS